MDNEEEFDSIKDGEDQISKIEANRALKEEAARIQAKSDAFRDLADRFYMLWWNLPGMTPRDVDRDIRDMFRMYMDLAPSLGVSRNGIPELRECCGRKRVWPDDVLSGSQSQVLVMAPVTEPDLGWCPGDIIRRITRVLGFKYCEKCDRRRKRINKFFRCGNP
jgi:hypothetical protein